MPLRQVVTSPRSMCRARAAEGLVQDSPALTADLLEAAVEAMQEQECHDGTADASTSTAVFVGSLSRELALQKGVACGAVARLQGACDLQAGSGSAATGSVKESGGRPKCSADRGAESGTLDAALMSAPSAERADPGRHARKSAGPARTLMSLGYMLVLIGTAVWPAAGVSYSLNCT